MRSDIAAMRKRKKKQQGATMEGRRRASIGGVSEREFSTTSWARAGDNVSGLRVEGRGRCHAESFRLSQVSRLCMAVCVCFAYVCSATVHSIPK